ncbi:MAG TPA: hypothetical protein VIQ80_02645 [Candidatus Saccharimonadales bacterium]
MFIVGLLGWWYSRGWALQAVGLREKMLSALDYFSIDLLFKTLFSPFRQISAGKVRGPLGVQMRAFFDRLISRAIGGMIRITMIIVGGVAIFLYGVLGAVWLVLWGIMPFLPVVGMVLFMMGWIPWTR